MAINQGGQSFGLAAKVNAAVDRDSQRQIEQDVTKAIEDAEDSVNVGIEGRTRPGGGARGGGAGGAAAGGGLLAGLGGGGAAKMLGTVALGGTLALGMFKAMENASAKLQSSLGILGKAFDLAWKPFGDVIGDALLPHGKDALKAMIEFNKKAESEGLAVAVGFTAADIGIEVGKALEDEFPSGGVSSGSITDWLTDAGAEGAVSKGVREGIESRLEQEFDIEFPIVDVKAGISSFIERIRELKQEWKASNVVLAGFGGSVEGAANLLSGLESAWPGWSNVIDDLKTGDWLSQMDKLGNKDWLSKITELQNEDWLGKISEVTQSLWGQKINPVNLGDFVEPVNTTDEVREAMRGVMGMFGPGDRGREAMRGIMGGSGPRGATPGDASDFPDADFSRGRNFFGTGDADITPDRDDMTAEELLARQGPINQQGPKSLRDAQLAAGRFIQESDQLNFGVDREAIRRGEQIRKGTLRSTRSRLEEILQGTASQSQRNRVRSVLERSPELQQFFLPAFQQAGGSLDQLNINITMNGRRLSDLTEQEATTFVTRVD